MTTTTEPSFESSLEAFFSQVRAQVGGEASEKGYAVKGNGRALIDSVAEECGEGHARGEIRYKLIRWRQKRNPVDLFKIAAWAFLEWDRHQRTVGRSAEVPTIRHTVCPVCGLLRGAGVQPPTLSKNLGHATVLDGVVPGNGHVPRSGEQGTATTPDARPEAQADGHP